MLHAQVVLQPGKLPEKAYITTYANILNVGNRTYTINQIRAQENKLSFQPIKNNEASLGFTKDTYWVKFSIKNNTDHELMYYLETAEPVTDNVNLYLFKSTDKHKFTLQKSGDNIDFSEKSIKNRATLFKIELMPHEEKNAYLEIINDGEKNNLPLILISQESLLQKVYHEQIVFGVFYGILLLVSIFYLFFYFALQDRSFLYYSVYVIFVALCHFSLDGYYHQYLSKTNSWFSLHAVIIFAILGSFFFGKYTEEFLNIKKYNPFLHRLFSVIYFAFGAVFLGVLLIPAFLEFSYPIVNVLTLAGMLLILASVVSLNVKKQPIDIFFTSGIAILFLSFTVAILLNFGVLSLGIDNITKLGIGLEVIALSLSMSNRIRLLKTDREKLQTIALQRSQEMNEVKSYFLSNMSHELRTPLNAILGIANSLEADINDQKVKEKMETIKYVSDSLISSVNDILDFSKIEKGELQLQKAKFNPIKTLEKLTFNAAIQAKDKGLSFDFIKPTEADFAVIGDEARLSQIINNVLNNAIKFTVKGGVKFIVSSEVVDKNLNLNIEISDTGIGISQEKINTVFDMFTQVNIDNKRKFGGFGIGLCIVKALVDLHEGEVSLESTLNEGTTCKVVLSYELVSQEAKAINLFPTDHCDLLGKTVLVVEDNQLNQMVVKMILKKWANTKALFAADGAESLEVLKNNEVDIILMDLQMPVMDGYEATAAIRNSEAGAHYKDIPIIVLTADVMESTKQRVFELGVNDYMTKPVDQHVLYEKITTQLSQVG
ncbi:hybrid sensor histidine kinase/response regulator [Pedobacter glucosidilyticus]|uniref:hybrid sensor histidine kinase/response regulator n=1 Tax=Pedobacter glucosidilyticus TaxID=1122941 RepID=UPI0026EAACFF|nr:hybrid sensor histidine kinase/response regulator [Pedobacter glucosidilyticus]